MISIGYMLIAFSLGGFAVWFFMTLKEAEEFISFLNEGDNHADTTSTADRIKIIK